MTRYGEREGCSAGWWYNHASIVLPDVLCTINRAIDRIKLVLLDYIELGWR